VLTSSHQQVAHEHGYHSDLIRCCASANVNTMQPAHPSTHFKTLEEVTELVRAVADTSSALAPLHEKAMLGAIQRAWQLVLKHAHMNQRLGLSTPRWPLQHRRSEWGSHHARAPCGGSLTKKNTERGGDFKTQGVPAQYCVSGGAWEVSQDRPQMALRDIKRAIGLTRSSTPYASHLPHVVGEEGMFIACLARLSSSRSHHHHVSAPPRQSQNRIGPLLQPPNTSRDVATPAHRVARIHTLGISVWRVAASHMCGVGGGDASWMVVTPHASSIDTSRSFWLSQPLFHTITSPHARARAEGRVTQRAAHAIAQWERGQVMQRGAMRGTPYPP
jgi:hypothetical protein